MTMQANGYSGTNVVGVMITNNANDHHPSTYAKTTAEKIVVFPFPQDDPTGEKLQAARLLRENAQRVLEGYHRGIGRIDFAQFGPEYVESALADFLDMTKGTMLEQHYSKPPVQDLIRFELAHEFGSQFQFIAANQKQ